MSDQALANLTLWGFVITLAGFAATLWALRLTYLQASEAKRSSITAKEASESTSRKVEEFSEKRDRSEAIQHLGKALQSIEVASVLIDADRWKEAGSAYDDARRSVQTVRSMPVQFERKDEKSLVLICDHLRAFSDSVDNALQSKEEFPDKAKVRSAIRKNSDDLNHLQRQLHEGLT